MVARPVRYGRRNKVKLSYYLSYYLSDMIRQLVQPSKTRTIRARPPCQTPRARSAGGGGGLRAAAVESAADLVVARSCGCVGGFGWL